ncbi:universal stress protein [Pelotomaculum terephthalicicum JT]|uniref:universal stress protein n=1 Tax=Pelotomaculum TaxID=191373 RepID=UPI0009D206CC|nr:MULTISPECIES: universal stress protein [Pelotomaculum]MCG9969366.1 universal stress protein [Pelotomaculum terephthalicicum JT]OPX87876.1 MAG: Universal stress protein G [Pelotomaculum sp. PtaB.Bin117]OPY64047.1 MAG: Universal stress protein G [Pelotomaculum sp. PtaU1.Bin065]
MIKILVPVDGSAGSDKAVRFAIFLAEGKNKEIILINVQPSYNTPNIKRFFSQEQIRSFQEELSKEVLDHTLEITNSFSIPVRTVIRIGDPGKEICAEAEESSIDFIVMGYRGLGAVKRAIMGSVATHVLHETTCPVMIVP